MSPMHLCMQYKEKMILHYYTSYGKLMSHLCILVLPIYFKCSVCVDIHNICTLTHIYMYSVCVYMCIYIPICSSSRSCIVN